MEQSRTERRTRIVTFAAVVAASVTTFVALGGAELAQSAISLVQYQYGKKVTICHKGKTITIAARAWPAHKRHGDAQDSCRLVRDSKQKDGHGHGSSARSQDAPTQPASPSQDSHSWKGSSSGAGHGKGNGDDQAGGKGNGKSHGKGHD